MAAWFFSQGDSRKVFFNQWVFDLFTWLPKSEGPVLQWNSLGALVCVIIPPLFGIAFFQNRRSIRAGALALGLFFAVVLFLSASGGGWIASAIGLAFVFVCWRRWILSVIIPVYGILAAFAYIYYGKYHWLSAVFSVNSLSSRFEIWRNTLHLFTLKIYYPFTGLGLGSVNNLYNSQFGRNINHTHNSYLQLYADTGILGLLGLTIAVVIFIRMSRAILSAPKQNTCYGAGIGLIGGIISYAAFALFDVTTMVPVTVDARYIYMSVPLLCLIAALFTGVYFLCRKPS
jgi:O-antigen ligase